MAELKVLVVHNEALTLTAGEARRQTEEIIAEENMHIVGFIIGWALFTAMSCSVTICKAGIWKEMGSYTAGEALDPTDFPMFYYTIRANTTALPLTEGYQHMMLRDGDYYLIKKDDRFYCHFRHTNSHATSSYNSAGTIAILYY